MKQVSRARGTARCDVRRKEARTVALVPHEKLNDAAARILLDFVKPVLDVLEAFVVRHVVHHHDALRAPVVAARDGAEALLPRCVPHLQLHKLAIDTDRAVEVVDADSAQVDLLVLILRQAQQQARLAHARVADHENLEQEVRFDGGGGGWAPRAAEALHPVCVGARVRGWVYCRVVCIGA
jgi:hypothetical protein